VASPPGSRETGAALLVVPYDPATHRYEIELWGVPIDAVRSSLGAKGRAAVERGALVGRPDLVHGTLSDFQGSDFDAARDAARRQGAGLETFDHAPEHTMHPVRTLQLELAWTNEAQTRWDALDGRNYQYEFAMRMRGWRHYLGVGHSDNPHGGLGGLEYRNLFSNYFGYERRRQQVLGAEWRAELGRELDDWNFDADGRKPPAAARETFLAVDYMDLHVLKPDSAIGLHRHRDNQEVFLMLQGKGLMVTGDWAQQTRRHRAIELRTMRAGDLALIKGGQLHGLINSLDEPLQLFMFGGYD
jgi:mannose-6-phosphate isomerase-like protein (cupin superfamily)